MGKVKISSKLTKISDRIDIKNNVILQRIIKKPGEQPVQGDLKKANAALREEKAQ